MSKPSQHSGSGSERAQLLNGLRTAKQVPSPNVRSKEFNTPVATRDDGVYVNYYTESPPVDHVDMRMYLAMQQKQQELLQANQYLQQQARLQQLYLQNNLQGYVPGSSDAFMGPMGYPGNAYMYSPSTPGYSSPSTFRSSSESPCFAQSPSFDRTASPSFGGARRGHRKATSTSSSILRPSMDMTELGTSLPSPASSPFGRRRMSREVREGMPSRQPFGPPAVDELTPAPNATYSNCKNFAARRTEHSKLQPEAGAAGPTVSGRRSRQSEILPIWENDILEWSSSADSNSTGAPSRSSMDERTANWGPHLREPQLRPHARNGRTLSPGVAGLADKRKSAIF